MPIDQVSNNTQRFRLAAGKSLVVTPFSAGAVSVVAITTPVAGISFTSQTSSLVQTVGPFSASCELVISAVGTVDVETMAGSLSALVSGARIADSSSRPITAADNGASLAPTGALTYTIPDGLSPMPSFSVDCPASGIVTIARSGAATLNGAGTSLTRTRASNPVGFVVLAHVDTDAYGVSGS